MVGKGTEEGAVGSRGTSAFLGQGQGAGPRVGGVPAPGAALGTGLSHHPLWGVWGSTGWSQVPRLPPAPPCAAASLRRAHRPALPWQRQLLHAAIYSEGHLLLSVVAKPSKDCMPRRIPAR